MQDLPSPLVDLARARSSCLARSQPRRHGVGPDVVRRRVAGERWQRVGPRVVALHAGPLPPGARRWAALLHTGRACCLGAWTALAVHGLEGWDREDVHVVTAHGRSRGGALDGTRLHLSHRWHEADVTACGGPPVHRVERAAVDAATWSSSGRTAGGLLAAVLQQRLTTPARLADLLDRVGPVRHRGLLLSVVADLAGGCQAMSEVDLAALCRRHRLPPPHRQAVRTDGAGRRRHLDGEWLLPGGRRVLLEVDGVGHLDPRRWCDDLLRAAEVSRPGETVLRLPALALRLDEARVAALLRVHLVLAEGPREGTGPRA